MTSGAVQPPGSTGHSQPPTPQRNSNVPSTTGGDNDESDNTSYTDDEELDDGGVDEIEDEEDRLILNGGAGIPIGPVRIFIFFYILCLTPRCSRTGSQDHYYLLLLPSMQAVNASFSTLTRH
jgi:hypothetical protein